MEALWGIARAVLVALLLAVLLVRLFEDRLIFFPSLGSREERDPRAVGLPAEDVFFSTADGVALHGWWVPAFAATREATAATIPTILYFHGNAGNLTHRIENILFLCALPANVFAVDYRGYGKSKGRPTEKGVYQDAEAAYDYLVRQRGIPPEQVVVLGQSLGTAVAVELATRRPVAGLLLESGFPSAQRVAQRVMWLPGLGSVIRSRFDSAAKLQTLSVPVLVAHARGDPTIPYSLGEELFAAANQPKTFVSYNTSYHEPLFLSDPVGYADRLRSFLGSLGVDH